MPFDAAAEAPSPDLLLAADVAAETLWRRAPDTDREDADLPALLAPLSELARAAIPRAAGGASLATDAALAPVLAGVLRRVGGADLSAGRLFEGHVNAVKLVDRYAGPQAATTFFAEVAAGAWSGVWNAEAPPGLRLENGRLDGRKVWCSGAGFLTRPLVTARDGDGAVRLLAPRDTGRADVSGWTPAGMRATATGTVDFTGVAPAPDETVGEPGDYYRAPLFKGGAWRFLAVHLGAMERLERLLADHLRTRGRTGDPHQRARFAEAADAVETARLWVASAARRAEDGTGDPDAAEAYVNLARGAVERAATELLGLVDRSVGLEGRMRPSRIERVARDLATYLRQPFPDGARDAAAAHRLEGAPGALHP